MKNSPSGDFHLSGSRESQQPHCLSSPLDYQWARAVNHSPQPELILPVVSCFYYLFWDLQTAAVSGSKIHAGKIVNALVIQCHLEAPWEFRFAQLIRI